jgi:hypothetical protein
MSPRFAAAALALTLLAPQLAQAARRATVLLIPLDRNSYGGAARLTEFLEDSIGRNSGYSLKESARLLGDTTPTASLEARKRVIKGLADAKKLLIGGQFDEAEAAIRAALVDMEAAIASMDRCAEYCDAVAYLASVQLMKGDDAAAREGLKGLFAVERSYKFDGPAFPKTFQVIARDVLAQVTREAQLGNLSVQTTPPGGRVFVDGDLKGYAPLTVERLSAGRHLLRVERPGSITYGQLVDVSPGEEGVTRVQLTPTPEWAGLEALMDRVADGMDGANTNDLMKLGAKLKVDRAIVGTVRGGEGRVQLDCVLVDFAARRKLARKARAFEGEEYGELGKEVRRFGNLLLNAGDARPDPKQKKTNDPLDYKSGMEDWDEESTSAGVRDAEPAPEDKPKKKKKVGSDPLDKESGTSDW